MVVSPQRLTRWPSYVRDRHAAITYTTPRDAPLRSHLTELKLAAAAEALPAVLDQASAEGLSLTVALERLLAVEVEASTARRLAGRLRFACLPTPATLADFDVDAAAGIDRKLIDELGTCRYLESATNILLIGPPGTGKTHLSVGLARAAAHAGYRTYFTTAADLAARCHRAAIEGRWATTMRFYAGQDLTRSLDFYATFPFPKPTLSKWLRGDYANLTAVIDLTLSRLDAGLFTGTFLEGELTELELQWGRTIGQMPSPYTARNPLVVPYHFNQGP